MKKEDIKGMTPLGLVEGMRLLTDLAKLRKTGTGGALKFHIGDTITIPDMDQIQVYTTSFTTPDGKEREYEVVKVGFNDRVKLIPIGSFRRDRNGIDEIADAYTRKSALCRDLNLAVDDFERLSIIAGHTIVVKDIFDGRSYKYANNSRVPYNKDDINTFTTGAWPVFEFVD